MGYDAEILAVGDELLRGEVVNSNATWLADRLGRLGLTVGRITAVGDDLVPLAHRIRGAAGRCRVLLLSGGLGPTDDDRTARAVADAATVELELFGEELSRLRQRFAKRGFTLTPNNEKQAWLPSGAKVVANRRGTAPGFTLEMGGCLVACMPGVPAELKVMFDRELAPRLAAERGGVMALVRKLSTFGVGESHLDHRLAGLLDEVDADGCAVSLHFRTSFPLNHIVLVVRPPDASEQARGRAEAVLARLDERARQRVGRHIFSDEGAGFADAVVRALAERGQTVALAESCTGGQAGDLVTSAAGSSTVFQFGAVVYSNAFKHKVLGVPNEVLERHGAVSSHCVEAMAEGVRRLAGSTYGVAISGIAGPGGGTPDKPVGTVHFALATPDGTVCEHRLFPFERGRVKTLSAHLALALILRHLGLLDLKF